MPSRAELRELLDYDPRSGEFVWLRRPTASAAVNARLAGKRAFTALNRSNGARQAIIYQRPYSAHRVAWKWMYDEEPDLILAVNGDLSDCRIVNLYTSTKREAGKTTSPFKHNSSGTRGVSWHCRKNCWFAHIKVDGRPISLGYYADLEAAASARAAAEVKFGFRRTSPSALAEPGWSASQKPVAADPSERIGSTP